MFDKTFNRCSSQIITGVAMSPFCAGKKKKNPHKKLEKREEKMQNFRKNDIFFFFSFENYLLGSFFAQKRDIAKIENFGKHWKLMDS